MVVRLWSGERREARRLRRDRERRRGWRRGGAGSASGSSREFFNVQADPDRDPDPLRLMLEYAGSQRAGLRGEREAPRLLAVVRSIDWILFGGRRGARRRGALGRSRASRSSRVPNDPTYYLNRQILYACVGGVALIAAALIYLDLYRRYWRGYVMGTALVIAFVLLVGHAAHGSRRVGSAWGFFTFQPSEFGKLLFVLAIAGMLAERQRELNTWETTLKVVGIGLVPVLLVFPPARPRDGARVHRGARGDALGRRRAVAAPRPARLRRRPPRDRRPLGGPGRRGQPAQELPAAAPDVLHASGDLPIAARYNLDQSKTTIGSGQFRAAAPTTRPRSSSASSPRAGPTSSSPASPSSGASSEP